MLNGLRARLLASYILLLLITLAVTAGVLLVLLSARPAPAEQVYGELLTIARTFNFRTDDGQVRPLRPMRSGEVDLIENLTTYANEVGVRLLIIDPQTRQVIVDSQEQFVGGASIEYRVNPIPPDRVNTSPRPTLEYQTGEFMNVDSEGWLFISFGIQAENRDTRRLLLLATERPTTSLIRAVYAFSEELGIAILQAGALGVIVAVILAVIISRNIAQPLQNLSHAAAAVAQGDYSQRVDAQGPNEVQEVARAFNRMSEQVELNNQAQRDLLANVSHDLKTPLTSIQGFSQAIMDGTAPNPQKAAGIIFEEAGRLARLVSMLTELTRLQAGRFTMRHDPIDLSALVDAMSQKMDVVAQRKNIDMRTLVTPVPPVKGDGDKIAQVVNNLLSNAVKYTPEGGQVITKVEARNNGVQLIVKDTGIGIPPSDISRIFERFYQVDKSRGGVKRGHGLGLAITHEIVQAHGGQIQANSEGENMGSTFIVWFPAA